MAFLLLFNAVIQRLAKVTIFRQAWHQIRLCICLLCCLIGSETLQAVPSLISCLPQASSVYNKFCQIVPGITPHASTWFPETGTWLIQKTSPQSPEGAVHSYNKHLSFLPSKWRTKLFGTQEEFSQNRQWWFKQGWLLLLTTLESGICLLNQHCAFLPFSTPVSIPLKEWGKERFIEYAYPKIEHIIIKLIKPKEGVLGAMASIIENTPVLGTAALWAVSKILYLPTRILCYMAASAGMNFIDPAFVFAIQSVKICVSDLLWSGKNSVIWIARNFLYGLNRIGWTLEKTLQKLFPSLVLKPI